jgi:ABC-type Fe3+/spermidine/putrescine transport system ATPase subunit
MMVFDAVSKAYGGRDTVRDFSLEIGQAERVVLVGHSGCGKTTVLRLLAGFVTPDTGNITINGETVSSDGNILTPPERRNLGMVFQDLALWPHMTVRENLEFGLTVRRVPRKEREEKAMETLRMVQMESFSGRKPGELSGGQQQRVALARALVLHPGVLLMDEPLGSLDPHLNALLRQEIIRLHQQFGFALLYVTHSREEALDIGARLVLMREGRIERIGSAEEFRAEWGLG